VWLQRLFVAAGLALEGSRLEKELGETAEAIGRLLRAGVSGKALNDQVLEATSDLRASVAAEA
jgi:hypothetical protein